MEAGDGERDVVLDADLPLKYRDDRFISSSTALTTSCLLDADHPIPVRFRSVGLLDWC